MPLQLNTNSKCLTTTLGQPVLSLLAALPLHLFSKYSGAGGEDAEKCSDFNYTVLILSILTKSNFITGGKKNLQVYTGEKVLDNLNG